MTLPVEETPRLEEPLRVLLLGGTGEARRLAGHLAGDPRYDVISSLAGRTADPDLPPGRTRIGGFGGPDGLAAWLRDERIGAVVDATHPFAALMTESAVLAAERTGVPLLVLRRPGWTEGPGDDWRRVPSLEAAAADLPGERVFLTTGRKNLAAFAGDARRWFLVRSVDPPEPPLPPRMEAVLARGPFTVGEELALMREHAIDALVTKDSGSAMTSAKLAAARTLRIPVVMVDRPPAPDGVPIAATVEEAAAWLDRHRPAHEG
ncbi:Precorrin-6A reductase [Actinomadura sp. RB99]|uniref:cobalt-precorrin-6A reductase n=1 Tax=Actinomadura sp. RB99 TaxID=2691577 RepID=UPI00198D95F5|nr:Precorrin-6A reductase [Actinomadura sp. RB99]